MKIFDCLLFNNELDLLEIRCNELKGVVDVHVLCESKITFTALNKPLNFKENQRKFNDFNISYKETPPLNFGWSWGNEWFQRNYIYENLLSLNPEPDDIVLLSDTDEIPNKDTLVNLIKNFSDNSVVLLQDFFHYGINCFCYSYPIWHGTVVTRFKNIKYPFSDIFNWSSREIGLQALRENSRGTPKAGGGKNDDAYPEISNGGWHYTYCFGVKGIQEKLRSYSHSEMNAPEINNTNYIESKIKTLKSLNPQTQDWKFKLIDLNKENTPEYIIKNLEKFNHLIIKE